MKDRVERPGVVRFGLFEFDVDAGELRRQGRPVKLQHQPGRVLALLVARAGHLVSREELIDHVWRGTVVDYERGLAFCIRQIRTALGDTADSPRYVVTVPRQGFRFIAPVEPATSSAAGPDEARNGEDPVAASRARRSPSDWLLAVVVASVLVAAVVWAVLRPGVPAASPARPLVIVLPFECEQNDADLARFCDGLTEATIVTLASTGDGHLGIIGNAAELGSVDARARLSEIGAALGADHALLGSVSRDATTYRVFAHVLRTRDQSHEWGETFTLDGTDTLRMQELLARRIADAVGDAIPTANRD